MNKVTILRGLQGSGKTTWAKQQIKDSPVNIRVNKDELRKMMFGESKWKPWHEKLVLSVRDSIIHNALGQKRNVIVDDTNFNPIHEQRISEIPKDLNERTSSIQLEIKDFELPLDECIANDLRRPHSVGERVIRATYEQYVRPRLSVKQNPDLDDAVIFDLDGTLALIGDRNPYDATDCGYDKVNYPVFDAMMHYKDGGHKIIICSGRSSKYLNQTDAWLGKNGIKPDLFLMRKEGDIRKDCIIKREMFMKYILPKYYVNVVYDDRKQVVDMWRDLGLTVFQVADGEF